MRLSAIMVLAAGGAAGATGAGAAEGGLVFPQAPVALPVAGTGELRGGQVLVRFPETADRSEVFAVGAVRIAASTAAFQACAEDPSCLFHHGELLGAGRFASVPAAEDLRALKLDARDQAHLARCRVGQCDVRLSAGQIDRFAREVAGARSEAAGAREAIFRSILVELARDFAQQGDAGLTRYDDDARPVAVRDTLRMLRARDFLVGGALEGGGGPSEYLAWRQERFWRQNLTALEHLAIRNRPDGGVVVVAQQIYASHYYDGAVSVFAFTPGSTAEDGVLVHVSRARADIRPTGFTWIERVLLRRLVRGRLERHLGALRDRLEAAPTSTTGVLLTSKDDHTRHSER